MRAARDVIEDRVVRVHARLGPTAQLERDEIGRKLVEVGHRAARSFEGEHRRGAGRGELRAAAQLDGSTLRVEVADDGVGGADGGRGSGIRGLQDRVAALGGRLSIESPRGQGTRVIAEIPVA